jgi:hypothetical protein
MYLGMSTRWILGAALNSFFMIFRYAVILCGADLLEK